MSFLYNFAIIGGDNRQMFLADLLARNNYSVCYYGLLPNSLSSVYIPSFINHTITATASLQEAIEQSNHIICPTPFSKDQTYVTCHTSLGISVDKLLEYTTTEQTIYGGAIPASVIKKAQKKNIKIIDVMKLEHVAQLNAIATAEGAISEAITHSVINLQGSHALILGFGRCGQILAKKLSALDASVTVSVRKKEVLAQAEAYGYTTFSIASLEDFIGQYDYIFNTIPAMVMPKQVLLHVNQETTIIDISSHPGGVDFNYANDHYYNANLYLGLPGRFSPKSSAQIILNAILSDCNQERM